MKTILYALLLSIPLVLAPANAAAPSVAVAMDADSYSIVGVAGGYTPVATITVLNETGAPVPDVSVRVVFLRQVQFVGYVGNETVMAQTDADGTVSVTAPTPSSLPGSYVVAAFALGTTGSDRYTIGA